MLIAITGGIGSGKSVVSNVLRAMGYDVYDCDTQAKQLMSASAWIKDAIAEQISPTAITRAGNIDRKALAAIVFADSEKLAALNAITHAAVRQHLQQWQTAQPGLAFVETAILYQSGLDRMVEAVWEVIAPEELRIERVMARNGLSREEVSARIASQAFTPAEPHARVFTIINDGQRSLLEQINDYLALLQ